MQIFQHGHKPKVFANYTSASWTLTRRPFGDLLSVAMATRSGRSRPQIDSASLFLHFVHDANEFEAQTRNYYRYVRERLIDLNDKEGKACLCVGTILIYPLLSNVAMFVTSLPYARCVRNEAVCLLILIILQVIGYLIYLMLIVHRENAAVRKWIAESRQTPDPNYKSDQILEQLAHERRKKISLYGKNLGDVYYAERCSSIMLSAFLVIVFVGLIMLLFSQKFWAYFWLCFAGVANLWWGKYKLYEHDFACLPRPPEMHREDITKHLVAAQRSWQLAITDGTAGTSAVTISSGIENQRRTQSPGGPIINEMD